LAREGGEKRRMTSRERVLLSLEHRTPDRLPMDFASSRVTGIHALTYNRLTAHLGLQSEGARVYDVPQMLADPEEALIEYFESDVVQLHRLIPAPPIGFRIDNYKPGRLQDGTNAFFPAQYDPVEDDSGNLIIYNQTGIPAYMMPKGGFYFSRIHNPMSEVENRRDLAAFDLHEFVEGEEEWLQRESRKLGATDFAVLGQFGGNFLERGNRLFGMEKFLIMLISDPDMVEAFFDRLLEATIEDFDRYLKAVEDRVDIIQLNDDLGHQDGPLISEQLYKRLVKPYQKKLYEHIRSRTDMVLFLHSCGSIYPFIPHLIEMGVQVLNPVQYMARDMNPERLKREFGKDIAFWGGGCDTQQVLAHGSADEVRRETGRMIDVFAPGGGFVFAQVHNIQPLVPIDNVLAMFDVVKGRRAYVYG
jgi:uroporphyrinogen decarboxylase